MIKNFQKSQILGFWILLNTGLSYFAGGLLYPYLKFYTITFKYAALGIGPSFQNLNTFWFLFWNISVIAGSIGLISGYEVFRRLMIGLCGIRVIWYLIANVLFSSVPANQDILDFRSIYMLAIAFIFPLTYITLLLKKDR